MFLDPGMLAEPRLSMDHFREWASEITSSYLNAGAAPTDTLVKIAQSEDLTPHQVEVLAGEANKMIHSQKYASADEKYFAAEFPLADARQAIAKLQVDGGSMKLAFHMPAPRIEDKGPSPFEMFGVKEEPLDKTATVRHELKNAQQKVASFSQQVNDKLILDKFAAEAAEKTFMKQARQMVLQAPNSSLDRMKVLGQIDHFSKCASLQKVARPALAKLACVLRAEGLIEHAHAEKAVDYFMEKKADQKAPQELISDWIQAKVVNGNHPLYITLKTLADKSHSIDANESRGNLVKDHQEILTQKIRAL